MNNLSTVGENVKNNTEFHVTTIIMYRNTYTYVANYARRMNNIDTIHASVLSEYFNIRNTVSRYRSLSYEEVNDVTECIALSVTCACTLTRTRAHTRTRTRAHTNRSA